MTLSRRKSLIQRHRQLCRIHSRDGRSPPPRNEGLVPDVQHRFGHPVEQIKQPTSSVQAQQHAEHSGPWRLWFNRIGHNGSRRVGWRGVQPRFHQAVADERLAEGSGQSRFDMLNVAARRAHGRAVAGEGSQVSAT
jgi:hypothetical protein